MLTPIEIQTKTFKSGGLGYDKRDVDQFFKEVNEDYMRLYGENIDLKDKVAALNNALQQYKTMEKTLQRALVLAEKTAEETKEAALKSARNIEKEAITKSQIIMADARNELEYVHAQTLDMLKQFDKYKAQFKSLAAAQIELLDSDSYSINASRLEAFIDTSRAGFSKNETNLIGTRNAGTAKTANTGAADTASRAGTANTGVANTALRAGTANAGVLDTASRTGTANAGVANTTLKASKTGITNTGAANMTSTKTGITNAGALDTASAKRESYREEIEEIEPEEIEETEGQEDFDFYSL